jgi:hypothetical protein
MPLYNSGVSINKQSQGRYFSYSELFNYTSGDKFYADKLKLIPIPTILYKVCLAPHDRKCIEVIENTVVDLKGKKVPLNFGKLINLANLLGEFSEKVDLWLGIDNEVTFVSKPNKTILKLEDLEKEAVDLTEEKLVELLNLDSLEAHYFALDDDKTCYHIAKNSIYKATYSYMVSWFDNQYPGVLVSDNAPKSVKVNQEGMKLLTFFYLKSIGVKTLNIFLSDYPEELIFSLEEKYSHKLCTSKRKNTAFLDKRIPDELLDSMSDNKDNKTSIVHFPDGYMTNICTSIISDSDRVIPTAPVSWNCFLNNYKKFYDTCKIVLAKNEIILDENNKNVFSWNNVDEIVFYGYENSQIPRRNSIEITMKEEPSNAFLYGIKEYFNKLGLSIFCIKVPESKKFIFGSSYNGDDDDEMMDDETMAASFARGMFES